MKIGITSGYYNPIHVGHIDLLRESKKYVDFLVVIVNNDKQVKLKGSQPFINEEERKKIVESIRYVDCVYLSQDTDKTVVKTIESIYNDFIEHNVVYFLKGGDSTHENTPEQDVCTKLGISVIFNVGGGKVQSSSWLLDSITKK